jgi:hypothetical protein
MSRKVELLISTTTGLLLVYTVMASLSISFAIVFFLFMSVAGLTIWMVVAVLKDTSNMSGKKFDNYFYEDVSIKKEH